MFRLIKSEYKKLWKNKVNIIIVIILFVLCGYQTYKEYSVLQSDTVINGYREEGFNTLDGKSLEGLSFYKYADEVLHSYDRIVDRDLMHKFENDYKNIVTTQPKIINKQKMVAYYGEGYDALLARGEQGKMTPQERDEVCAKINGCFYEETQKGEIYFRKYYESDATINLYDRIYRNRLFPDGYSKLDFRDPLYVMNNKNEFKTPTYNQNGSIDFATLLAIENPNHMDVNQTKIMQKFHNIFEKEQYHFDSVVPNNVFINALSNIDMLTLIVITIILANMFALEIHHKTDQIIIPTKVSNKRIALAKLLTGLSFSACILLGQVLLITIMSFIFLPIRDIDLMVMDQAGIFINLNSYVYSYREVIFNAILLMLMASMVIATITMTLSSFFKKQFAVVVPMLLIIVLTSFLGVNNRLGGIFPFDQFSPSNMMDFSQFYRWNLNGIIPIPSNFIFNGIIVAWKDVILITWIPICCLLCLGVYMNAKRHRTSNR